MFVLRIFMDAIRRESVWSVLTIIRIILSIEFSSPRRSNKRWGKARASHAPGRLEGQREEQRGTPNVVGLQAKIDTQEDLASRERHQELTVLQSLFGFHILLIQIKLTKYA